MPSATCQYCGWTGPADHCRPLTNACERVHPGDIMPAGECPKCNASAMLEEQRHQPGIKIDTTAVPEFAATFTDPTPAYALADLMSRAGGDWAYHVDILHRAGFRVAVHRPGPQPLPQLKGYLRITPV